MTATLTCVIISILIDQFIVEVTFVMIFTFFFEISLGSILWIYLVEISTEKGMSIALFLNWLVVIAVSFATAPMITASDKATFGLYAVLCFLGGLFALFFMKETRGKTFLRR